MVDPKKYISKSFKNPHLKDVAFEIRFPANVRILKEFYRFQELINEKYPNYGEDLSIYGLPDDLQPPETLRKIAFISQDNINKVKISINSFVFITSDYSQYERFKGEIIDLFEKFKNIFNIKSYQRIGIRYINLYILDEDLNNSIEEASELFHPIYNLEKFKNKDIVSQNIEIRTQKGNNIGFTYRTRFQYDKKKEKYFHVLDFDTFTTAVSSIENYEEKLDVLHDIEKSEFLLSVSRKFIDEMEFLD